MKFLRILFAKRHGFLCVLHMCVALKNLMSGIRVTRFWLDFKPLKVKILAKIVIKWPIYLIK